MREIKFRAWDKGKMDYSSNYSSPSGDDLGRFFEHNHFNNIMQFIGMKDKNGKEIYEGDIISIKNYTPHSEQRYEIKHNEENANFEIVSSVGSRFDLIKSDLGKWYEVIGNIFENPELLENK